MIDDKAKQKLERSYLYGMPVDYLVLASHTARKRHKTYRFGAEITMEHEYIVICGD